jgi:hypothetical protein
VNAKKVYRIYNELGLQFVTGADCRAVRLR